MKLTILLILLSLQCFAQLNVSRDGYQRIPDSLRYDDALLKTVLSQQSDFYWEYRFRIIDRTKRDSLFKVYGSSGMEEIRKLMRTDYTIVSAAYKNKHDSLKLAGINSDEGCIPACLPSGHCFYYIICLKNDSVKIVNNRALLHSFILPIDRYEKAILWSIWKGYEFSTDHRNTGYYRKHLDTFELIAEETVESRQRKNGRWKDKVAQVHLKIKPSGEIIKTVLRTRTYKNVYKIMI